MAREYPRFIFSNPQNTKSKGPFVVHLLEPRMVFKVVSTASYLLAANKWTLYNCDVPEGDDQIDAIAADALNWLLRQIQQGFIQLS